MQARSIRRRPLVLLARLLKILGLVLVVALALAGVPVPLGRSSRYRDRLRRRDDVVQVDVDRS